MEDMIRLKNMIESEIEELENVEVDIIDDDTAHTINTQIVTFKYVLDLIEGM